MSTAGFAQIPSFSTLDERLDSSASDMAITGNDTIYTVGATLIEGISKASITKRSPTGVTEDINFDEPRMTTFEAVAANQNTVVVLGGENDGGINTSGLAKVFRSTDGATFELIDQYESTSSPEFFDIALDDSGNVYLAGTETELVTETVRKKTTVYTRRGWIVRRIGVDGSKTNFRFSDTAVSLLVQRLAITCAGTKVFIAGSLQGAWQVRRSIDYGLSWSIVDNFKYQGTQGSYPEGITASRDGSHIYVVGHVLASVPAKAGGGVEYRWFARKGSATIGEFSPLQGFETPGLTGWLVGITEDSTGGLHTTGQRNIPGTYDTRWVTRSYSPTTNLWSKSDDIQGGGVAIASDSAGNIYSAGYLYTPNSAWALRGPELSSE